MKKSKKLLILPLVLTLAALGFLGFSYYFTPRDIATIDLPELEEEEFNLSKKDYSEDFDFAYAT
ncbi:MAG: hypothetical protein SOW41_02895, partial [Anaerococcus sp.]|nr:hypothetical protein [Peptoniphilaceae bacterium]MDY3054990.1 hypothetical protein [Anaerococcus sp.]